MEIYKNIVSIVSIVFKPFRKQELIYSSRYALVVFWTLIIINDPLIIINTRYARNIDVSYSAKRLSTHGAQEC